MACASVLQRGFISGRQLLQNVVDLDVHSRINALQLQQSQNHSFYQEFNEAVQHLIKCIPVTVLFDYASAFPSISHKWILAFP